MVNRRDFLRKSLATSMMAWAAGKSIPLCAEETVPTLKTRGLVLDVKDLSSGFDWPQFASEVGLTTLATHFGPDTVVPFMQSDVGKKFYDDSVRFGLQVEHELHAMKSLLPRDLFAQSPELFRMDEQGNRNPDANCCPHSSAALEIITKNAIRVAKICRSTTHRYFFWIDDGLPMCSCPKCRDFSFSDQALLIENAVVKGLRAEVSPDATLAHLAYFGTLAPPTQVKPDAGVFLEYAPISRKWDKPISESGEQAFVLEKLDANLQVFPAATAQVLEYWVDVSLFSGWKEPHVEIPWLPDVCRQDVALYAQRGIRNFTSFGVYMDSAYFQNFPRTRDYLREYAQILRDYKG